MQFIGMYLALIFLLAPSLALGEVVQLPRTGQNACYDQAGNAISCAGTGQDGDWQMGVEWPTPRFKDNNDGTLKDELTGLIWIKNDNCLPYPSWQDALNYAKTLNSGECGLSDGSKEGDWRLPNINELESLLHAGQEPSNVQWYWSSTTRADNTGNAWFVINNGHVSFKVKGAGYAAWPVRGATALPAQIWKTGQTISYATGDDGGLEQGVAWPSQRFTDNNDGTVTDNLTGLLWLKKVDCMVAYPWQEAMNHIKTLKNGDCELSDGSVEGDWRLPNRKELMSLIDYSQSDPAIPSGHPFINLGSRSYWSSTSDATNTNFAWFINMWEGNVGNETKGASSYVWPVRSPYYNLHISKPDTGAGTVTSSPPGIDCGGDCLGSYMAGTKVTLTAVADSNSIFSGWSGDGCSGTGPCIIRMDAAKYVNATFISNLLYAILALQVASNMMSDNIYPLVDVNGDGNIGIAEAIYALQKTSSLR